MIKIKSGPVFWGANHFSPAPIVTLSGEVGHITPRPLGQEAVEDLLSNRHTVPLPPTAWPKDVELHDDAASGLFRLAAAWAHVILNEVRGSITEHGAQQHDNRLWAWVGFHDPELSLAVLGFTLKTVFGAYAGALNRDQMEKELQHYFKLCRARHPDYQACIVMKAARARGIPYGPAWGMPRHWRFGEGEHSRVLFESSTIEDGALGVKVTRSKAVIKNTLLMLGLPAPRGALIHKTEDIDPAIKKVGLPCVTKPLDLGGGKGVTAGLYKTDEVHRGIATARASSKGPVLVEQFVEGDDHRLIVINGTFAGAIRRDPAAVIGDGHSTIRALVDQVNKERFSHSLIRSNYHRQIKLDESALLHLSTRGLTPETVLPKGQRMNVRSNANLSTGGTCTDVTDLVHPVIRQMSESIAKALNIEVLGADYVTNDISKPSDETGGSFIEINATPGLDAMVAAGWTEERAGDLCLPPDVGRVPKSLIIVKDDDLDPLLDVAEDASWPQDMGWACATWAGLGKIPLSPPSKAPNNAIEMLLQHRVLARAVLIFGESEISNHGIPVDHVEQAYLANGLSPSVETLASSLSSHTAHIPDTASPQQILDMARQPLD